MSDDLRHDQRTAAVFAGLILLGVVFVVGIQVGIRQGKSLAGPDPSGRGDTAALAGTPRRDATVGVAPLPEPIQSALEVECGDEHLVAAMIQEARMYVESSRLGNGDLRRARNAALAAAEASLARVCLDWWRGR